MAKTPSKKAPSKVAKASTDGKKKRSKKCTESYSTYIYKVEWDLVRFLLNLFFPSVEALATLEGAVLEGVSTIVKVKEGSGKTLVEQNRDVFCEMEAEVVDVWLMCCLLPIKQIVLQNSIFSTIGHIKPTNMLVIISGISD